jgi:hypothetical protein
VQPEDACCDIYCLGGCFCCTLINLWLSSLVIQGLKRPNAPEAASHSDTFVNCIVGMRGVRVALPWPTAGNAHGGAPTARTTHWCLAGRASACGHARHSRACGDAAWASCWSSAHQHVCMCADCLVCAMSSAPLALPVTVPHRGAAPVCSIGESGPGTVHRCSDTHPGWTTRGQAGMLNVLCVCLQCVDVRGCACVVRAVGKGVAAYCGGCTVCVTPQGGRYQA